MLLEHAKLLYAIQSSGEIIGRKKFQKMIYIAKKLSFPYQEKFQFHFYGPYSEELTLQLEELVNMGFVNETKEKKNGYFQYRYTLTESGQEFVEMFNEKIAESNLDECLTSMNSQSARFLELVSTILYFEDMEKEEIYEKIAKVKGSQNYSDEEIEDAFKYIAALKEFLI